MNAAADRTGIIPLLLWMLTMADGAEVHIGDVIKILRVEEPRPHSNVLDMSRIG